MPQQFSRKELYDLAWAEPMRDLAAKLGLSDVGLAKIYRKAEIPIPPRGYWAKKKAGSKVVRPALSQRLPGGAERIWIGGEPRNWAWGQDREQMVLATPVPPELSFDEDMEVLAERIRKTVGHVPFLGTFQAAFGDVSRLLAQDEKRRVSQWSWDKPKYDAGPERRRLLILHSLFFALRRLGCTPSMRTAQYISDNDRGIHVRVREGYAHFTLEPANAKGKGVVEQKEKSRLRLAFTVPGAVQAPTQYWDDTPEGSVKHQLTEVVVQILVHGEQTYRDSLVRERQWLIDQKEETRKAIERRKAEQLQKEREQREREEKARIDGLLAQAADLQRAAAIRAYVKSVREDSASLPVTSEALSAWVDWALGEADRIDPTKSARFLELMTKA